MSPRINVLFSSTSYPNGPKDWRAVFMAHICAAFVRRNSIRLLRWAPPGEADARIDDIATPDEAAWLANLMKQGGISHLLRSRPITGIRAGRKLLAMLRAAFRRHAEVDLYHVNWLQSALALPPDGKPALITALGNDMNLLRLPMMRYALRRVLRNRKAAICPNATWMEAPLRKAFGDLAHIKAVPFGIDPRWYGIERMAKSPPRWLVVTRLTANKLGPLFEWGGALFSQGERELHLFGPMQEQIEVPAWAHYHGPVTADLLANEWFPQASGLITLSRHAEGRPQVMLEAMASTLPLIASPMPAHSDIVRGGVTGVLCDSREELAQAIGELENAETNFRYGVAARKLMKEHIGTWDDCISRYLDVYTLLLRG